MASLREIQRSFAAALRDPAAPCPVLPPGNLGVYRNNAAITFRETLECAFPVVRRRVGDDYFRQLAAQYRAAFPSRHGDLHWIGRDFPPFLGTHLADTDYAWLADLARLEWLRCESAVAADARPLGPEALADVAPDQLERLRFDLQPALRLMSSPYPVFSVWEANRSDVGPPVDQSLGEEAGMTLQRHGVPEVRKLDPASHAFVSALAGGASLGEAVASAALDQPTLAQALTLVFAEGLITSLSVPTS